MLIAITIIAVDKAGNISDVYRTVNPYYEDPLAEKKEETPLPENATPTEPTDAEANVTEHTTEANKEFYTIQTDSEKVFYLIIDKTGEQEKVYFLTEISERDLLNVTSDNSETLPMNSAVVESALPNDTQKTESTEKIESTEKKQEIIQATWRYLLKTGLTHASVGDLCRETKIAQSSLYYWFENKDDIWISAGRYGLSKVVDALFAFTLAHTSKVRTYFDLLLDEVEKYKYELRLAIQITTSPIFGKRMRDKSKDFRLLYENYAEKIIKIFNCTHDQAEIFIYSIIAFVIDYALWDDRDKTQMLLDNLYNRIVDRLQLEI